MAHKQVMKQVLEAWDDPMGMKDLCVAMDALRKALEQPEYWDKPSASFNAWWDSDYDDSANPFRNGSAAYWAWAGWQVAQRPWQGLTDEAIWEIHDRCIPPTEGYVSPVDFARAIEAKLKEKNT